MIIPVKHAAHFINGYTFKPSDWGDVGLPIIRIAQLTGDGFDNYFDGDLDDCYHISDGDLLFSWSATLDSFEWNRGPALLNQHIFRVIPRPGTHQRFLFYSLKHYAPLWAAVDAHGSTMHHIKKESLGNKVWLPSLAVQKALVAFLGRETAKIDALIAEKERLLSLLAEKRRALITQAVTRGLNPDVPMRDSGVEWLGGIPRHWGAQRLAFLFRERDERDQPELPLLNVSIHTGVTVREFSNSHIEQVANDFSIYKVAYEDDIAFNKMRMWQGAVGRVPSDGLVSPDYVVAAPIANIDTAYYGELFSTAAFSAEAARNSHGIVWDRLRLYWEEFRDIRVPVPPLNEQQEIMQHVAKETKKLDGLRTATERAIELLRERRTALISAAVTGQIRIGAES